jgi:hypothetical protein
MLVSTGYFTGKATTHQYAALGESGLAIFAIQLQFVAIQPNRRSRSPYLFPSGKLHRCEMRRDMAAPQNKME